MKPRLFILLTVISLWGVAVMSASAQPEAAPARIVGYFTSWSIYARAYSVAEIPADRLTHINYAFVNYTQDGQLVLADRDADTRRRFPGDPDDAPFYGNFRQLNLLKDQHPGLQTLISIGGWTLSAYFSDVAASAETRERFAESAVAFMTQYGFDGIDIDWEYPTGGGHPLNHERPDDPENFILLLSAVRDRLNAQSAADGRPYLLTIAAGASTRHIEPIDWVRVHPLLDWINVMAYDMIGGWSSVTGFNAPLYNSAEPPPEGASADAAMRAFLAEGVPADKLVLGVPFYGRSFAEVRADNNGLHQPFGRVATGTWEAGFVEYSDVAENYLDRFTRYWSETAGVPWLYDAESQVMITYDDPESLRVKADYVRANGFGGIMLWELSADDDAYSLLNAIYTGLNGADG